MSWWFIAVTGLLLAYFTTVSATAETLSAGKLLIASDQLRDPNFSQTVILLTHYSNEGAAGLVINRPTQLSTSKALPGIQNLLGADPPIYMGGPVAINTVRLLVRSSKTVNPSTHIHDDIYFLDQEYEVASLFKDARPNASYRFYAGYSGWGAGQLEAEVLQGSWHILNAREISIFDLKPELLWPGLIERFTGMWALNWL